MRLNLLFLLLLFFATQGTVQAGYTHWVCQDCDPHMQPNYNTISKAVEAASPNDTILIVAEEFPPGGGRIVEYEESITINKPLTIKCKRIHPVLGQPVIKVNDFESTASVISVEKSASGTVISNLHIRGPSSDNTSCKGNPLNQVNKKVGLRIETPECSIEKCKVTHCMTGILVDTGTVGSPSGIKIEDCIIGEPFVGVVQGYWVKEEAWTTHHKGHPIVHPGNGFGIVVLESPDVSDMKSEETWYVLSNCSVQSNRYQQHINPPNHVKTKQARGDVR